MRKRRMGIMPTIFIGAAVGGLYWVGASKSITFGALAGCPILILVIAFMEWAAGNDVVSGWPPRNDGD